MNLAYYRCQLNDLKVLTELSRSTFIDAFEKQNNPEDFALFLNSELTESKLEKQLINENSEFYFIYKDQSLIGFFKLNCSDAQTEKFDATSMELERIYIRSQYQGKNYGSVVLNHIIEMAKSRKVSFLWLGVWEKNVNAIRFYERFGFYKFSSHSFYIGNDKQTDELMKLDLV